VRISASNRFSSVVGAKAICKPVCIVHAAVFGVALAALICGTIREALATGSPTVTSISPTNGVAGTIVTINGTDLSPTFNCNAGGSLTVYFNGIPGTNASNPSLNPPIITVTAPVGSGTVDVTVSIQCFNGGGGGISPINHPGDQFTYTSGSTTNTDSQKLNALEIAATKTVASISGQVITGAVDGAISDAFGNGGNPITFGANGMFINFAAEPKSEVAGRTDDAFAALAYAGNPTKAPIFKAPALIEHDWSAWADVRGTGFDQSSAGDHEEQINVTGGIGRKLSPDLLVGVFTGYENFSFTMESIAGKMTGDGGTIGTYAAWRFAEHWRIDGMLGWSDIFYNGTAGTASGSFTGSRWLGSGGLTGTYRFAGFVLEPSARIYTLWERDNAYTDSLGTAQGVNSFSESRVSTGGKISYPWPSTGNLSVVPYAGLYTDYRFSTANALPVGVPFVGIQDGWSERVTTGVTLTRGRAGPSLSLGGELGGLGAGYEIWSANARANWPF
jgi:hypothetical protein